MTDPCSCDPAAFVTLAVVVACGVIALPAYVAVSSALAAVNRKLDARQKRINLAHEVRCREREERRQAEIRAQQALEKQSKLEKLRAERAKQIDAELAAMQSTVGGFPVPYAKPLA